MTAARWGMTIPVETLPLTRQGELARELEDLGYTDLWSSEATHTDGFTPLAIAGAATRHARLGVAIAPAFTRGPALLAQTAATLAASFPGRFALGVGSSSDVIVQRWNDVAFTRPLTRVRDTVRFLRAALAGEKVDQAYDTFTVQGFRLGFTPDTAPPVLVAGLRGRMLELAGAESDGAIINWLSAEDVATVVPRVLAPAGVTPPEHREIVARVMVVPTADAEAARVIGRRLIAAYLNVAVYRAFHEELGRADLLGPMWKLWAAGDRRGALAAIPDRVVDDLVVHGPPDACREHLARYVANGVTTPVIALPGGVADPAQACRDLAPR